MSSDDAVTVLLLTDPALAGHAWPGHPERPERIPAVVAGVVEAAQAAGAELVQRTADPAPVELLASVHDPRYVGWLAAGVQGAGGWLDADTYLVGESPRAAMLAAGLTMAAALASARGEATVAFAAVRPPGHHAGWEGGKGFCILNNVAVAVAALRAARAAERVAVLDWDVHHGDGSEALFADDHDTFYASTHQYPWYPGTGSSFEGETLLDVPLPAGSGDEEFVAAWQETILPRVEAFGPDALLISAGYDAHRRDPLAGLEVTEEGFREVARAVGQAAREAGLGGVAVSLEGGYDLDALRSSSAATVTGLLDGLTLPANGKRGN